MPYAFSYITNLSKVSIRYEHVKETGWRNVYAVTDESSFIIVYYTLVDEHPQI